MSIWSKLFQNWQWHNRATATDTPLNAVNMQKINDAIDGIDDRVITLQQDEDNFVKKTGGTMTGTLNINAINGSSSDLHLQSSANNDVVLEAINGDDEPVGAVIISDVVTVEETFKVADLADDTVALELSAEAVSGDVRGKIRFKYDDGEDVQHEDIYIDSDGAINVSADMKINGDLRSTGAVKTDSLLPNTANTALDVNGMSVSDDDNGRIEISPGRVNDTLALISSDTVEIESEYTLSLTSTGSDIEISADDAVDIDGSVVNVTANDEVDVQDIRFVKALPSAHVSCVGALYFLTNDQTGYTKGMLYECVATAAGTYSWQPYSGDYMRKGVDYVTAGQKANTTLGNKSTAEGNNTTASGNNAHSEGYATVCSGNNAHSEGTSTTSSGNHAHSEGRKTTSSGEAAHAEGRGYHDTNIVASGAGSHAEGATAEASSATIEATSDGSHAGGYADVGGTIKTVDTSASITAEGAFAHGYVEGSAPYKGEIKATNKGAVALGYAEGAQSGSGLITASGKGSVALGSVDRGFIEASGEGSLAGGSNFPGDTSHINASGKGSFAYGMTYDYDIIASGRGAVAVGYAESDGDITASGNGSFAGGCGDNTASGNGSFSFGYETNAANDYAVAMGENVIASGQSSHAEGCFSVASGEASHAQNYETIAASDNQTAIGKYNVSDDNNIYALIIGNGTGTNARSNAFGVKWTGETVINGDVVIGQHYDSTQSADVDSNLTVSGIVTVNGSDYAERFEEAEPCPVNRFVTLDGEKIRLAQSDDDYILGVTSENPAIIGDKDNDGVAVGLIGKLWVVHDGSAKVNGFVVSGKNGIAIAMENMVVNRNLGYRVMAVDGNRCKILVK